MRKYMLSTAIITATTLPAFGQGAEGMFRTEADPAEIHASDFIGMRVYRSDSANADSFMGIQDNWDDIGEINDVILTRDGMVEAVLVDIGGFLGIGENQVAVDMSSVRFVSDDQTTDDENDFFLVLNAPRDALEGAPKYGAMGRDEAAATESTRAETPVEDTASENTATGVRVPIQREGYAPVAEVDLTAERLTGAPAYDANDEWIGELSKLVLSDDGKVKSVVVDVGGFLGIGEKPVELQLSDIDILQEDGSSDTRVYISMTKAEMEAMPDYEG